MSDKIICYDVIQITIEEYKKFRLNKEELHKLIDFKCELMAKSIKERIKEGGEEYYNKERFGG